MAGACPACRTKETRCVRALSHAFDRIDNYKLTDQHQLTCSDLCTLRRGGCDGSQAGLPPAILYESTHSLMNGHLSMAHAHSPTDSLSGAGGPPDPHVFLSELDTCRYLRACQLKWPTNKSSKTHILCGRRRRCPAKNSINHCSK